MLLCWWFCCAGDFVALVMLFALATMFEQVILLCCWLCWVGDCVVLGWWFCCAGVFVVSFCVFEGGGGVSAKSVFEECLAGVSANSVSQECLPIVSHKSFSRSVFRNVVTITVFKRCFPCVSCQACLPKIVFPRVFSICRGKRVSEDPSSCPLSSFLLSPFFSSTWHSGSWDTAHYWPRCMKKKRFPIAEVFTRSPRTWIHSGSWLPSCFLGGIPTTIASLLSKPSLGRQLRLAAQNLRSMEPRQLRVTLAEVPGELSGGATVYTARVLILTPLSYAKHPHMEVPLNFNRIFHYNIL